MEVSYSSPISPASYPMLGTVCMSFGFMLMAFYFIYQMRAGSDKRSLALELCIGGASSVALGFGTLFVMLSFGLYV